MDEDLSLQERIQALEKANRVLQKKLNRAEFNQMRLEDGYEMTQKVLSQAIQELEQTLSNLQQTQTRLVQSEKMSALGNLVAGVAHEINNPVGFLVGNLEPALGYIKDLFTLINLYQQEYPDPSPAIQNAMESIDLEYVQEDLPKLLNSMKVGIQRICEISTSLRIFSRADQDYTVPFNIHDGIDSTLLILQHRLKAYGDRPAIEIIKKYGDLPAVECFPGQLNQVFMNLLANAIDALEETDQQRQLNNLKVGLGQITIQTQVDELDNRVIIQIQDNGIGMTAGIRRQIFDHLFTTKAIGKGTGLGLAIARQIIVEKHGGAIEVHSTLGAGTEFLITLPVKSSSADSFTKNPGFYDPIK